MEIGDRSWYAKFNKFVIPDIFYYEVFDIREADCTIEIMDVICLSFDFTKNSKFSDSSIQYIEQSSFKSLVDIPHSKIIRIIDDIFEPTRWR